MLLIDSTAAMARALDQPLDPDLRRLLVQRRDQLLTDVGDDYDLADLASFLIVAPRDSVATIEDLAGYPVITQPAFEWVERHGRWYEAVTILSDDGYGIALFVPDETGIDPTVIALMADQARQPSLLSPPWPDHEPTTMP